MKRSIIDPNRSYSFSDYFEMNVPTREVLAYFGYSWRAESCILPKTAINLDYFHGLKETLDANLRVVPLTNEASRREILVAPILLKLGAYLQFTMDIEYSLNVTKQLKGKIDYYLHHKTNLLIIEAKHDDMTRGFTQLATELIALDQWLDDDEKPLYGIITIGDAWRFGVLDRVQKQICQDIRLYAIPTELDELLRILIAILTGEETP